MNREDMYAVILAGGQGKRFWPLSTSERPKQLLKLLGEKTFLEMAVDRIRDVIPLENILVLTNQSLVAASREAAPSLPSENIIGEPLGRDTAPAVALSSLLVEDRNPNAVFCILTADQIMKDVPRFQKTIVEGANIAARQESIITIGIEPSEASTSFGYIEYGGKYEEREEIEFHNVKRFVEKPDSSTAKEYLEAGNYLWNAGMFIWSVQTLRNGLNRHAPHLTEMMDRLAPHVDRDDFMDRVKDEYEHTEKISIDYALMEKADNIIVAKGAFEWDDLGSWPSLANHFDLDKDGNVAIGMVEGIDSRDNVVLSRDRLTALIGVEGLVVVQAEGVTLVCPKERAQDVKKMVEKLSGNDEYSEVL